MPTRDSSSALARRGNLHRRGQAAIFLTLSLVVTVGMVGMVVDFGWAYWRKTICKSAAQAAALAAVKASTSPYSIQSEAACTALNSGPLHVGANTRRLTASPKAETEGGSTCAWPPEPRPAFRSRASLTLRIG
jgi:Flp pilus assembly protein TadG